MRYTLLTLFSLLLCLGCVSQPAGRTSPTGSIQFIVDDATKKSGFPFSNAVAADGWIFLSGSLGTVPGKGLVPGGIEAETRQIMENIQSTLARQGLAMDQHCQVHCHAC